MNQKNIHDLIKLINKTDISEFRMKNKEFSILIRSNDYIKNSGTTVVNTTPTIAAAVPNAPAPVVSLETDISKASEKSDDSKYVTFKSPIVGTFYRKPSPDKDVFVKVGDTVSNGSILCVIEAMKLFNEIECEISGKIVKILADDSTPVEYDQALFLIDPS